MRVAALGGKGASARSGVGEWGLQEGRISWCGNGGIEARLYSHHSPAGTNAKLRPSATLLVPRHANDLWAIRRRKISVRDNTEDQAAPRSRLNETVEHAACLPSPPPAILSRIPMAPFLTWGITCATINTGGGSHVHNAPLSSLPSIIFAKILTFAFSLSLSPFLRAHLNAASKSSTWIC